ncbi:MAG: Fic family protein [Deltaproteobacteria bacterium]|nr:Fic family protein [Deltaproteobacteria bacterium]
MTGLDGKTKVFNFKPDLGKGDVEFTKAKKYWYYLAATGDYEKRIETFTAKEASVNFLKELVKNIELPEQILFGEPSIRDKTWRENFRKHLREVFKEINPKSQIQFFPEPFAVFQYYRNTYLQKSNKSELVLIIDIGGGTFNTCIIKTTDDGYLSRGGGTSLPLGMQAEVCGGNEVDNELLEVIIKKAKEKGIKWKDDPRYRADVDKSPIMLHVEDAKIKLSEMISDNAYLSGNFSKIIVELIIFKGMLHPDIEFTVQLTGEDLKQIIRKFWRKKWGEIIIKTINEAKDKLSTMNYSFKNIDKVIVAGGSSKLPFMKEEIYTVLPTLINKSEIFIAPYLGRAVAAGLAFECIDQLNRNPQLSAGKIAPCLLNDLYFGIRKSRQSEYIIPKIRLGNQTIENGQLISEPFIIEDFKLTFDFEMPFEPSEKLFYCFCDQPIENDGSIIPLNISNDVFSLKTSNKIIKKWHLEIEILKNGLIKPTFIFKEKGLTASKEGIRRPVPDFILNNFRMKNGNSFIGIDFGTSNSYVVELLHTAEERLEDNYPEFSLNEEALENLRKLEKEILELRETGLLELGEIIKFYKDQMLLLVFHSNKIEGNPLTKGETEIILTKNNENNLNKNEREAYNLEKAFMWTLENYKSCFQEPQNFIRTVNKMILETISEEGGAYRKKAVKISGVNFKPPISSSVPIFMDRLCCELKSEKKGRSAIEFAASMHTKLVAIHPFVDGNGRTARILVNAILLNYNLPPLIVNFDDKQRYLNALSKTNKGDISPLNDFFIECFKDSLDEFVRREKSDEEDSEILNNDQCVIDQIEIKTDPIRNALKEIGAELIDDPIQSVMKVKIETYRKSLQLHYEKSKKLFNSFRDEFSEIIQYFNSNTEYQLAGYKMVMKEFDMISIEKYIDFCNNKRVTRTWFLGFEIKGPTARERFLFFFVPCFLRNINSDKLGPVSLLLARFDGTKYRILESEPINLREIVFSSEKLIFTNSNKEIISGSSSFIQKTLIAEIIKSYL